MLLFELQPGINTLAGRAAAAGNQGALDEHSLIAKAKSGHNDAFGELYKRHRRKAYCSAFRILRNQQEAEDAVQRAFQRVLVDLRRFRGDSAFSTWLIRIVINEALMMLRQRRAREPLHEKRLDASQSDGGVEIADGRSTPEEILSQGERHAALHQAIARLGDRLLHSTQLSATKTPFT